MPEDRRLAAIMFTDIVGYTKLMGSDEDKAFDMLKRNHTIHAAIIEKHNGTLIKEVGDGTLVSFPLASDAVRCAIDIQKEAKSQNIPLKIGIHEGEMVMAGEDVLGDGVNIASRLQEISADASITISGRVYSDVKNKAGIKTKFIGDKRLKNVADPVKVYKVFWEGEEEKPAEGKEVKSRIKPLYYLLAGIVVVLAAIIIWQLLPTQKPISAISEEVEKSIAVLPFRNDSPDQANEYFCNGTVEAILTNIQKIQDLRVKSRTSAEQYRNPDKDLTVIAKELNVAFILEGSVQKIGDNIRITAQLIDGRTNDHLWAENYDGKYTEEILTFQSDVAKKIASSLHAVITPKEKEKIDSKPTSNIEAYDYVLRGWQMNLKYRKTADNNYLEIARNLATRALEIDPNYIGALGLKCYNFSVEGKADSVLFYANQIINIDPEPPAGYIFKGQAYRDMEKFDLAIEFLKRALDIWPDEKWVNLGLGEIYCGPKNDFKSGLPYLQKAIEIDVDPSSTMTIDVAEVFLTIGHYEKAEEYIKKAIDLGEECLGFQRQCECLFAQGMLDEALLYLDSICDISACEKQCNFYKFYVNMALRNFNLAESYYNQISESGTINDNLFSFFDIDSVLLGYMYKELGDDAKASIIFGDVRKSAENKLLKNEFLKKEEYLRIYFDLSSICAIRGDKKCAFENLEKAFSYWGRNSWSDFLQINLYFEDLQDEPEYKAFIEKAEKEKAFVKAEFQKMKDRGEIIL